MQNFEAEIKPQLHTALQELLQKEADGQQMLENSLHIDYENAVQRVRDHLKNMEIVELAQLIISLDACNVEMRKAFSLEEKCIYFIYLITTYMFDNLVRTPSGRQHAHRMTHVKSENSTLNSFSHSIDFIIFNCLFSCRNQN